MESVIIKKEVIEDEKKKVISSLSLNDIQKSYLDLHVDVNLIFESFKSGEVFKQFFNGDLQHVEGETLTNLSANLNVIIKIKIIAALQFATTQVRLITENMSHNQQMNILIDLRNSEDLENVQKIVSDTLQYKMNEQDFENSKD